MQEAHNDNHDNYQTQHVDGKLMGALPAKEDPRTIPLRMLLSTPKSPPRTYDAELKDGIGPDLRYSAPFEPFRGQQWGSCTISSQAEYIRRRERAVSFGQDLYIPDEIVNRRYFKLAGDPTWDTDQGSNQYDTGLYELDALNDFVKNGFILKGWQYKISGFASIDIQNLDELRMAIATFDGAKVCINVPDNLYHSNPDEAVEYVPNSAFVGGHSMYWNGYDEGYFIAVHTWSRKRQRLSNALVKSMLTESYSMINAADIKVQDAIDVISFKDMVRECQNTTLGK